MADYLVWAILCTILFPPTGIAAIVYSVQAKRRGASGDIENARRASHTARICCWLSFGIWVLSNILVATGAIQVPSFPR